ncbi:MAG: hypothetical protein NWS46_08635 [Cyclobacteriaceae bacterium]|nr:hypothetical protein [Cyclobacteriaceae bacterium]
MSGNFIKRGHLAGPVPASFEKRSNAELPTDPRINLGMQYLFK